MREDKVKLRPLEVADKDRNDLVICSDCDAWFDRYLPKRDKAAVLLDKETDEKLARSSPRAPTPTRASKMARASPRRRSP